VYRRPKTEHGLDVRLKLAAREQKRLVYYQQPSIKVCISALHTEQDLQQLFGALKKAAEAVLD